MSQKRLRIAESRPQKVILKLVWKFIHVSATSGMTSIDRYMFSFLAKRRKIDCVEQTALIENEKESTGSDKAGEATINVPKQPESSAGAGYAKFSHWDIGCFVGFKLVIHLSTTLRLFAGKLKKITYFLVLRKVRQRSDLEETILICLVRR